jgi:hypothetical protein
VSLSPREKVGWVITIISSVIACIWFLLANDLPITYLWKWVILVVVAVIVSIPFVYRFRNPLVTSEIEAISPSLNYGNIIVTKTSQEMHGGVYDDRDYYVEVINETPNTVAKNCRGSLDMPTEEIRRRTTVWEDGSQTINIGQKELLYLFRVSYFNKDSERTRI